MGEYKELFAHNLKRIVDHRKKYAKDVAAAVGVDAVTMSRWMNGVNVPEGDYIDKLAIVLEVEVREFWKPVQARRIRSTRDQSNSYEQKKARKTKASREGDAAPKRKTRRTPER